MTGEPRRHAWSGWPGAWCLDCGLEDADELDLAGPPDGVHHRYSSLPHTAQPCTGCAREDGICEGRRADTTMT